MLIAFLILMETLPSVRHSCYVGQFENIESGAFLLLRACNARLLLTFTQVLDTAMSKVTHVSRHSPAASQVKHKDSCDQLLEHSLHTCQADTGQHPSLEGFGMQYKCERRETNVCPLHPFTHAVRADHYDDC
jgi:hypothetical protein